LTFDDSVIQPGIDSTELEEYVLNFATQSGLGDRFELLLFGARLARDKHEAMIRYNGELTGLERILLEREKEKSTGFWKQSKFFKATIITASLGGMIQGWTQSANNSTIYGMPQEFGLCVSRRCDGNTADLWTFGMLNAIPLLSAGLFGTTLADPLQENFLGRRGSVMLSSAVTIASTIGASATHSVAQLAVCRAINGIALGAKASIIPIYSAEISPEHIRGAILANWQLADAAGIFLGFLANLIIVSFVHESSKCWRIVTNTVLIPTVPLLVMIYLMPESPRYLMKHGKYRKALEAFTAIQTTHLLASRDFMYAHAQLDFESRLLRGRADETGNLAERIVGSETHPPEMTSEQPRREGASQTLSRPATLTIQSIPLRDLDTEKGVQRIGKKNNPYFYHIGVTGYFNRLVQLWRNERCRRALLSASIAMISQQMTGVNTIAFLGTTVWDNSLGTSENPKTSAIIGLLFGAANYLGGLPAYWLSDKYGRSILLAAGLPNMAWSMLVFALLFQIPDASDAKVPLVSIFAIICK
jgi:MFS family permease